MTTTNNPFATVVATNGGTAGGPLDTATAGTTGSPALAASAASAGSAASAEPAASHPAAGSEESPMPNILYIHSHDSGRSIAPCGAGIATPNLARLADGGVVFRQAYSAAPTCTPSRSALLTGMYPHSAGSLGLAHRGFVMPDYSRHLVQLLKAVGYHTALAGVQHEAAAVRHADGSEIPAWQVIGYDEMLGSPADAHERAAAFIGRHAHAAVADAGGAGSDGSRAPLDRVANTAVAPTPDGAPAPAPEATAKPFFLSVGFHETHRVFPELEPGDDVDHVAGPPRLPDVPAVRTDHARFAKMMRRLDHKIGVVLDALDAAGLSGNTLVIATTDHGIAFPGYKCNLNAAGCGVFLIMRGPGGFSGGRTVDALVSHIDVLPTLFDVLGRPLPAHVQGRSFRHLVADPSAAHRTTVHYEVNYHAAYEPMRGVRSTRFAYLRRFDGLRTTVCPNIDAGESKSFLLDHGLCTRSLADEELYDLMYDPLETHNVIDSPAYAGAAQRMRGELDDWMRSTADPLAAAATVAAPTNAVVTPATNVDP